MISESCSASSLLEDSGILKFYSDGVIVTLRPYMLLKIWSATVVGESKLNLNDLSFYGASSSIMERA